jgi:amino-acid N-acetyltransferase
MSTRTPNVDIRAARIEDVPDIARLIEPHVKQRKLLPRSVEELRDLTQNGFAAESDGQIVGFAAVEIYSKKLAEVQCLAVAPGYQRRGIGKLLVEACVRCAREHDILELMAITASDQFLKECGFDYSLPDQKRALFVNTRASREPQTRSG